MYVSNIWYWSIIDIRIRSSTVCLVTISICTMEETLGFPTLRTSRICPMKLGVNNGIAIAILKDVLEWFTVFWITSASTSSWILN